MKPMLLLAAAALTATGLTATASAGGMDFWLIVNERGVQVSSAPTSTSQGAETVVLQVHCQNANLSLSADHGWTALFSGEIAVRGFTKGCELRLTAERMTIRREGTGPEPIRFEGTGDRAVRLSSEGGSAASACKLTARSVEWWPKTGRIKVERANQLDLTPQPPAAAEPSPGPDPTPPDADSGGAAAIQPAPLLDLEGISFLLPVH